MPAPDSIAHSLCCYYKERLNDLMLQAKDLLETAQPKPNRFQHLVCLSQRQKIFILLRDAQLSFQNNPETGYFTTASLTRTLLETASILILLEQDASLELLAAYLKEAQKQSIKRSDALDALRKSPDPYVAIAAANESGHAHQVSDALLQIENYVKIPQPVRIFPSMLDRCQLLGPIWEFIYHACYRDLSENTHSQLSKIMHSPILAFDSPDKGSSLLYEHSRCMSYAVEFWGMTILETYKNHPRQDLFDRFQDSLGKLLSETTKLIDQFNPDTQSHKIAL